MSFKSFSGWSIGLITVLAPFSQAPAGKLVGKWTMDLGRSTTEGSPLPVAGTLAITQSGDTLTVFRHMSTTDGNLDYPVVIALNGTPTKNTFAVFVSAGGDAGTRQELPVVVTAHWSGDTLVTKTVGELHGMGVTQSDSYWVSADGTTMTERRDTQVNGDSAGIQVMVFRRE